MRTTLLLDIAADACPDRVALGAHSFEDMRARARSAAVWMRESGAKNLAFVGVNGHALPIILFASGIAGLPFVPLNYRLPDADLTRLLERSAPALAIIDDDMMNRVNAVSGVTTVPRSEFEARFVSGDFAPGTIENDEEQDIAVLLFTSGTTGDPKAAVLRHENLASYVMSSVEFLGSDEDEAALVSVPPYHIAGISAILSSTYGGRRIAYLSAFSPEAWVDAVANERVTHAMVVPTMLDRILDIMQERGELLPTLRALSYGGGRMPEPVIARAMKMLPAVDFVNAYGLTETSSTIALLGAEDHRRAFSSQDPDVRRRLGSVGQPLPSVEMEIRREDGSKAQPGEAGEIYVRGDQVSGEYLGKSMLDSEGWFATNDQGWIDAGGYLFVEGRLDDVIVRGGENISPGEIEDVLRTHPSVDDVAVLGIHDDQWGEKIVAVIVPHGEAPSPDALAAHVKTKLRSTKTPEQWHFRSELPYNETGKLLRRILKAELNSL